jgi:hypothetical protein
MADLDNHPSLWDLALGEAERAYGLDQNDPALAEMLWVLSARVAHWGAARKWEAVAEEAVGEHATD